MVISHFPRLLLQCQSQNGHMNYENILQNFFIYLALSWSFRRIVPKGFLLFIFALLILKRTLFLSIRLSALFIFKEDSKSLFQWILKIFPYKSSFSWLSFSNTLDHFSCNLWFHQSHNDQNLCIPLKSQHAPLLWSKSLSLSQIA